MAGSQGDLWDWLSDPLGDPSAADLAGLSKEARLIAGGFGAVMRTFALVKVCRAGAAHQCGCYRRAMPAWRWATLVGLLQVGL